MAAEPVPKNQSESQLEKLANLLLLQTRLREAPSEIELGFSAVNDSLSLVDSTSALLWRVPQGQDFTSAELFAVSSSPLPEKNTPFSTWARKYSQQLFELYKTEACLVVNDDLPNELKEETVSLVSPEALWLPIVFNGRLLGVLTILRQLPWSESELRIMQQWSSSLAHCWNALQLEQGSFSVASISNLSSRKYFLLAAAVLLISFLIPMRLSVLAPSELKSGDSLVVRSPIQGVIDQLHVETNATVREGELLVSLDGTGLRTELEVAEQELEIARAEYRQSTQAAAFNDEASANLQIQRISLEKIIAQVNYLNDLVSRTRITAPEGGTVIVENIDEFVGRPVQLGERLMLLVDDEDHELELWLPVGDDIELPLGSEVEFFPNASAADVYQGRLTSLDYEAQVSPLGTLAYRARADISFPAGSFSRIGMRGTGKMYGEKVSLFYFLFRRPIAFLRQSLGQ